MPGNLTVIAYHPVERHGSDGFEGNHMNTVWAPVVGETRPFSERIGQGRGAKVEALTV